MKQTKLNKVASDQARQMSRGIPTEIMKAANKFEWVFIHKYPNLDTVLRGGDVISRSPVHFADKDIMVIDAKGLKQDQFVFIGGVKVRGVGKAVVEKIVGGKAYLAGMGEELEK